MKSKIQNECHHETQVEEGVFIKEKTKWLLKYLKSYNVSGQSLTAQSITFLSLPSPITGYTEYLNVNFTFTRMWSNPHRK